MKEAHLIDVARQVITDEEVLAAGILQPVVALEGTAAGLTGQTVGDAIGGVAAAAGVASGGGGLMAGRAAAKAQDLPRWTLVAVTPTKVHVLSVRSTYLLNARDPNPFAVIDRANATATHKQVIGAAHWTLADAASGREYKLECSEGVTLAHGNEVMELIATGASD